MKRYLIVIFVAVIAIAFPAIGADKGGVYRFDTTSHDFGTIKSADGAVSHTYSVVNIGDSPMVITTVTNGGCGCTTPKWTRKPIAPGDTGRVTITFDPTGRRGEFNREVRARIETTNKKYTAKLNFAGSIIP